MQALADTALVTAARDGDRKALDELLAIHLPLVYNIVGRALHGHPDKDDVVQETMLRVVQGLPTLREPERFRSWLVAIAIRQIQERDRFRRSVLARQLPLDEAPDPADPDAEFVAGTLNRLGLAGERAAIVQAGRWLSPEDRRLLALWWQEAAGTLTRAEVTEALGLTGPHTAVRIQRMKAHLGQARAVLAAWQAAPRCPGLATEARSWDRKPNPRWLKRLARHVRGCERCTDAGRSLAPAERLIGAIGLLPLPAVLPNLTAATPSVHTGLWSRIGEYLAVKPAIAIGTAVVGAAAVFATAVLQAPAPGDDHALAAPPSATATPPTVRPSSTVAPAVSAPPTVRPSGAPPTRPVANAPAGIYVSPSGSDDAEGTLARPYASLGKAVAEAQPGETIYLRGGTYRPTKPVDISASGTAAQRITLTAYADERPVIDATDAPAGRAFIIQKANYWTVRGLEIVGAGHQAYVCESCQYNTFERLSIHDNLATGFMLRGDGTVGNQVLDSDFYGNHDPGGKDADGLTMTFGSGTGNVVRGCRVYHNVDNGVEVSNFADPVTIDGTWSYGNGVNRWNLAEFDGSGNGFSLGGVGTGTVAHIVTRSAAWANTGYGFTESGNRGAQRLTNNTAFRNSKDGFAFYYSPSLFRDNLALGNNRQAVLADTADAARNSWNETGWNDGALRDVNPATAEGPRGPDGSLPDTDYLTNARGLGAPMS